MTALLARLAEDQPVTCPCGRPPAECGPEGCTTWVRITTEAKPFEPHLVEDPPVSGRSEPREKPLPADFEHDVRFWMGADSLYWECKPCEQRGWLDGGHNADELKELERQHTGEVTP